MLPSKRIASRSLSKLLALAVADQEGAASLVEVRLAQVECFGDAQPGAPEHDDQPARTVAVCAWASVAHDGDDLLNPGRVGRVAQALVARGTAGVVARHRCR